MANCVDLSGADSVQREKWAKLILGKRIVDLKTNCWMWTGATTSKKNRFSAIRAVIRINYKLIYVSRLAAFLFNGFDMTDPRIIRHTCDRPLCFQPQHLIPGTRLDNVRDKIERGRQATGAASGKTHLTESNVVEMYQLRHEKKWTCQAIGEKFGVCRQAVSRITRGKRWPSMLMH